MPIPTWFGDFSGECQSSVQPFSITGMEPFTEITKDIYLPVAVALSDAIEFFTELGDLTITTDMACKYAQNVSLMIKHKVTPFPSVKDIAEYIEGIALKFAENGMNSSDIALVEAYVFATFGFTGDELFY